MENSSNSAPDSFFNFFFSNLGCISRLLLNSNRERKSKLKLRSTSELKIMRNAVFLSVTNRILSFLKCSKL